MTTSEKNDALYEKMCAEQEKYREWLLSLPPEEILNHTGEYEARGDILLSMLNNSLEDAQADALLRSDKPLAGVYQCFAKTGRGRLDALFESMNDHANDLLAAQEKEHTAVRNLPVYLYSASHARENDELDKYRESRKANVACHDAIDKAIADHQEMYSFDAKAAVKQVAEEYGFDRLLHVCANTVCHKEHDKRFCNSHIEWARTMHIQPDEGFGYDRRLEYVANSHSTLMDAFIGAARHEYLLSLPLTPEDIKMEAINLLCAFQNAEAPNSPGGTHFIARVSPDFLARAGDKELSVLSKYLPFQSLSLTSLTDRKGIYAVISKDEDRSKKLRSVRPSVLAKLQNSRSQTSPNISAKSRDMEH